MDGYVIIVLGVLCILLRKYIIGVDKYGFQSRIPGFIRKQFDEKTLENTKTRVVRMQEVACIVVGVVFIVGGILIQLGVVHMKQ